MRLTALCSCLNTQQSIYTCSDVLYFLTFIQRSPFLCVDSKAGERSVGESVSACDAVFLWSPSLHQLCGLHQD